MSVVVIGIDGSLSNLGWLAVDVSGPRPVGHGIATTKATPKKRRGYQADDDTRRIHLVRAEVAQALDAHRPYAVALESPGGFKSSRAAKGAAYAHAIVVCECASRGIALLNVTVLDGKLAATGKGNASKDQVALAVDEWLGGELAPRLAGIDEGLREHVYDAGSVAKAVMDSEVVRVAVIAEHRANA